MNGATVDSTSPASETATTGGAGTKRKADGTPQQRSKRNRYISIACNECKRRKIKCNGETPCQRCGNLGLECLYAPNCCSNFKDTDDFKRMNAHIATLQQQVDSLYSNLSSLRNQVDAVAIAQNQSAMYNQPPFGRSSSIPETPGGTSIPVPRPKSTPKHPRFQGPTSAAFNIGVAKSSLQNMGITATEDNNEGMETNDGTPTGSPKTHPTGIPFAPSGLYQKPTGAHMTKDPIWLLTKEETIRLVNEYQDEIGLMYPMLDIDKFLQHANMLYTFLEAANRSGLMQIALPGGDSIQDDQTNILKLVLACALVLETSGNSELGKRMFEFVKPTVDAQLLSTPDCKGVQMIILTAMYYFHKDEEQVAWRMVGLACRLVMEIGLHRRETYNTLFANEEERTMGIRLFWSLYVLDRRWSLGTGMPFAMQDSDIDPTVPRPDESTPYLNAMIAYSTIGSKVWRSVALADSANSKISDEEIGYLDYQIQQWLQSIPPSLQFHGVATAAELDGDSKSRANHRLRILLYLRANQMRVLIYRPVLHTAGCIMDNLNHAHTVVDVAKDSIRVLHAMNQRTDLYRTQQVMFNYFLISALAVLFLAVCHAPAHFAERCRDEFYMGIELVRGLSADSYVSKRLWKTVKVLKEVGPKLGLNLRPTQNGINNAGISVDQADAHSTAAVAMAGLAGHQVDELALFGNGGNGHMGRSGSASTGAAGQLNDSPNGMANDLTSLFEAAGGYGNMLPNGFVMPTPAEVGAGPEALPSIFGNEDELSRILKDLF
ncbi:fungal-specific transcription factor-like protein [Rhizodiscina lignyota]|uniref:Fungal-specific transcription factor-like protein n=1 Tax=Rhizodiscina lignyota TaxID=1504668 RepID=A0A9P4I418_9PEZI|nr:fungal-specific transcription factor-like protein [Rhizodiscina lignyota]